MARRVLVVVALSAAVALPVGATGAAVSARVLPWSTPGPIASILHSVSCAGTVCASVGSSGYVGTEEPGLNPQSTVLAVWNSTTWTPLRLPVTAVSTDPLDDVSCGAPTFCVAVGEAGQFALTVVGGTWTTTALPAPSAAAGAASEQVTAVSCAASLCTAVGFTSEDVDGTDSELPTVWTLTSDSWGAATLLSTAPGSIELDAVSCVDATDCTAIGVSRASTPSASTLFVAVETAGAWESSASDVVVGDTSTLSVSCASAGQCESVDGGSDVTVLSGDSATDVAPPLPVGQTYEAFSSVSCTTAACHVAGESMSGSTTSAVVLTGSGASWTPSLGPRDDDPLGVSCLSSSECAVVGVDASLSTVPYISFAAIVDGATWTTDSPVLSGPDDATLVATSCATATACVAVGSYANVDGTQLPVVEVRAGASWSASSPALPTDATSGALTSVSCPTSAWCAAVGTAIVAAGERPYVDVLAGGRWSAVTLPTLPSWIVATTTDTWTTFSLEVSCASTSHCLAVGDSYKELDTPATFNPSTTPVVEELTGTSWRALTAPTMRAWVQPSLSAVSCWATTRCVAVGTYVTSSTGRVSGGFAATLDGTTWRLATVPVPRGGVDARLFSVSCRSSTACLLGGGYTDAAPSASEALLETGRAGGPWTASHPPSANGLFSLTCHRAGTCLATSASSTSGPVNILEFSGTTWSISDVSAPAGFSSVALTAVSCPAVGECTAVGSATELITVVPAGATIP